jgi:hypothetical protein
VHYFNTVVQSSCRALSLGCILIGHFEILGSGFKAVPQGCRYPRAIRTWMGNENDQQRRPKRLWTSNIDRFL